MARQRRLADIEAAHKRESAWRADRAAALALQAWLHRYRGIRLRLSEITPQLIEIHQRGIGERRDQRYAAAEQKRQEVVARQLARRAATDEREARIEQGRQAHEVARLVAAQSAKPPASGSSSAIEADDDAAWRLLTAALR